MTTSLSVTSPLLNTAPAARRIVKALSALLLMLSMLGAASAWALDVNTASAEELQSLKGIGPKRAEAIVEYREQNGPFERAADIVLVPGIGANIASDNAAELGLEAADMEDEGE